MPAQVLSKTKRCCRLTLSKVHLAVISRWKTARLWLIWGGNPIYSRKNPGELADFDEALEIIISQYPHKDSILRGSGASGAGATQAGVGKNTPKSLADCKTDEERVAWLNEQNNGE